MKLKLDENLPDLLVPALAGLGHDTDTVYAEQLAGHDDPDVWAGAQNAGRMLITQDLDFSDIRKFEPGTHFGLILVRLGFPSLRALHDRVYGVAQTESIDEWARCFVVVTDTKIRIRRPGETIAAPEP